MNDIKEIERSIIKTYRKELWAKFIKALDDYKLLKPNDSVCVCISGGKDSMLLAKLFQELKKHSDFEFDVKYLVMNPGYNKENLDLIKHNLERLEIPAIIEESNIFDVASIQEKTPCYLCARMRRGFLYEHARRLGCNKIALGHHFDDVIETTLMGVINSGMYQTMMPKLHSDNFPGMELIRPMYLIREKDIIKWAGYNELRFIRCACKLTEGVENNQLSSKRKEVKELIQSLKSMNDNVEKNIFASATNVNLDMILGYKELGEYHSFLDDYDKKGGLKNDK